MNGSCLFLKSFPDFGRETIAADSQWFVHIKQPLTGVLERKVSGHHKRRRKQIPERRDGIEADGPSIITYFA
jgi:hypothetical protein